jgi:hypothetical protein
MSSFWALGVLLCGAVEHRGGDRGVVPIESGAVDVECFGQGRDAGVGAACAVLGEQFVGSGADIVIARERMSSHWVSVGGVAVSMRAARSRR